MLVLVLGLGLANPNPNQTDEKHGGRSRIRAGLEGY